jgi:hypothetical protein
MKSKSAAKPDPLVNNAPVIAWSHYGLKALAQWLAHDRHGAAAISDNKPDELKKLMTFYKISRNFRGIDTGNRRQQLLKQINAAAHAVGQSTCTQSQLVEAVNSLAKAYDKNKQLTSAASKLIYLAHPDKGVIFDRNAALALGFKTSVAYGTFVEAWSTAFKLHKPAIEQARQGNWGQIPINCSFGVPNPKTKHPYVSVFASWNTARKQAGLPEVRMHDLRHSMASANGQSW